MLPPPVHLSQRPATVDHTHAVAQPGSVGPGAFTAEVYGTTTVAIDPDDAAAAGTSAKVSREDHGHEFLTAVPSSLAKTTTNAEGSSGDGARADHQHSTGVLPWGIGGREKLTADSSGITATGATDLNVTITPDTTRLYEVHVLSIWTVSVATGRWLFTLTDDATKFARIGDTKSVVANTSDVLHSVALWEPSSGGSHSVELRVEEVGDGSTLTLSASSTEPRWIWIKDIGLR